MTGRNERADVFLVSHGFAATRAEAQAAIRAGSVEADGHPVAKPAQRIGEGASIRYQPAHPYVSRGGIKLKSALDRFGLSPEACICLDLGASTGGFSQVLLERGASRVYAVDVGHGQMHAKIAADPRVVALEGVNARSLTRAEIPEAPRALTADVSFISAKRALAVAMALAAPGAWAVILVKPQFELGPGHISSGGIVRDERARFSALSGVADWVNAGDWQVTGTMESPIVGGGGNHEFLLAARKKG